MLTLQNFYLDILMTVELLKLLHALIQNLRCVQVRLLANDQHYWVLRLLHFAD